MVTRRILKRQLRLRPGAAVNRLILYLLAVAAARYRVRIHCYQVLGNHMHLILSYTHKSLPRFMQFLDSQLARALNCHQGEWETAWAPGSYNKLDFLNCRATVFKYLLYVLTNVVAAGLVRSAKEWPGVKILPHEIGTRAWPIERPEFFFDEDGNMPESVILETSMPPLRGMSADEARARIIADWKERERTIRRDRKAQGKGFLGAERALAQSPFAFPRGGEPRRTRNPRVASAHKWARVEAIQRLKEFLEKYRNALEHFTAGDRDVVFPGGTYQMQVQFGARCEDPAPP